jgi:hypothetical protein
MERDRFLIHFVTFVFFVVAFPDAYKQRADRALVLFVFYVLVLWPYGDVSGAWEGDRGALSTLRGLATVRAALPPRWRVGAGMRVSGLRAWSTGFRYAELVDGLFETAGDAAFGGALSFGDGENGHRGACAQTV